MGVARQELSICAKARTRSATHPRQLIVPREPAAPPKRASSLSALSVSYIALWRSHDWLDREQSSRARWGENARVLHPLTSDYLSVNARARNLPARGAVDRSPKASPGVLRICAKKPRLQPRPNWSLL